MRIYENMIQLSKICTESKPSADCTQRGRAKLKGNDIQQFHYNGNVLAEALGLVREPRTTVRGPIVHNGANERSCSTPAGFVVL
jgi:hypothetical protein